MTGICTTAYCYTIDIDIILLINYKSSQYWWGDDDDIDPDIEAIVTFIDETQPLIIIIYSGIVGIDICGIITEGNEIPGQAGIVLLMMKW